jgi:hypothetical protein
MQFCRLVQTFWRNLLPPSSRAGHIDKIHYPTLKLKAAYYSEMLVHIQRTTWHQVWYDSNLHRQHSEYIKLQYPVFPSNRIWTDPCVKAQNFMRDRWGSSRLHFVEVPEHVQSGTASSIVQLALCQHPKECWFASICTSHNGHTYLYVMLIIWDLYQKGRISLLKHCLWKQEVRTTQSIVYKGVTDKVA